MLQKFAYLKSAYLKFV